MRARELVELAALAASHGPTLVHSPGRIPSAAIEQYWTASKTRLERWHRAIKAFISATPGKHDSTNWTHTRAVLDEIFATEILTRVWTGVLATYDRTRGTDDAESVARSVFEGHLELRHRALRLLLEHPGAPTAEAVAANRFRRRCERWTDILLGYLLQHGDVKHFAFDPQRAADFADDLAWQRGRPGGQYAWPLTLVALRGAFEQDRTAHTPNPDANARVAASILACFPPEAFDGTGQFRSLWLLRLASTSADAQGLIADLLGPDSAHSASDGAAPSLPPGPRRTPRRHL